MTTPFSLLTDQLLREWLASPRWYVSSEAEERGFWRFVAALLETDSPDARLSVIDISGAIVEMARQVNPDTDESLSEVEAYNLALKIDAVYSFLDAQREIRERASSVE